MMHNHAWLLLALITASSPLWSMQWEIKVPQEQPFEQATAHVVDIAQHMQINTTKQGMTFSYDGKHIIVQKDQSGPTRTNWYTYARCNLEQVQSEDMTPYTQTRLLQARALEPNNTTQFPRVLYNPNHMLVLRSPTEALMISRSHEPKQVTLRRPIDNPSLATCTEYAKKLILAYYHRDNSTIYIKDLESEKGCKHTTQCKLVLVPGSKLFQLSFTHVSSKKNPCSLAMLIASPHFLEVQYLSVDRNQNGLAVSQSECHFQLALDTAPQDTHYVPTIGWSPEGRYFALVCRTPLQAQDTSTLYTICLSKGYSSDEPKRMIAYIVPKKLADISITPVQICANGKLLMVDGVLVEAEPID